MGMSHFIQDESPRTYVCYTGISRLLLKMAKVQSCVKLQSREKRELLFGCHPVRWYHRFSAELSGLGNLETGMTRHIINLFSPLSSTLIPFMNAAISHWAAITRCHVRIICRKVADSTELSTSMRVTPSRHIIVQVSCLGALPCSKRS